MSKLEELKSVIQCLSTSERKDVVTKLKRNLSGINKNASLELFNLIQKDYEINFNNIQLLLYGKQSSGAIKKLVSRLLERVLDVLIFKENIEQNIFYEIRTQDIFLLERQLLISEILRYRGLFKLSFEKLENVISTCKYYEHYDILLYALDKKRRWIFMSSTDSIIERLNEEINYFNKAKNYLKISESIYIKIFKLSHETFDEKNQKYLTKSNQNLRYYFKLTKSNQIRFYSYYTIIQQCYLKHNYKNGLKYIEELLDYLLAHKNIYSKLKHGNVLLNKGVFNRYCFKFDTSIQNIIESSRYFSNQNQNNLVIYEHLFLTYFYWGDISKLKYYLSIINDEFLKDDYRYFDLNKHGYYLSIYYFIVKEFTLSQDHLQNVNVNGDSMLFNLECKILFSLNCIELQKFDLADYSIERLRKYYTRINSTEEIFQSKKFIIGILTKLSLFSFDFKKTQLRQEKLILKLKELSSQNFYWDFEMLIFHEWFDAKVKGIEYDHAEVMKRLKRNIKKA